MIDKNTEVSFNYTLKVDGEVIEGTVGKSPVTYTHGANQIFPELENALEGMNEGEEKTFSVPPENAFGYPDQNAYRKVPKDKFSNPEMVKVNNTVQVQKNDKNITATIVDVKGDEVTLDLTHPLAGKTLDFWVEVVNVN